MKKKLLVILLVGIFLLTSITSLSAVGMKATEKTKVAVMNNDDLPDFIMDGFTWGYQGSGEIAVYVWINNIGSPVEKIDVPIKVWLEGYEDDAQICYVYDYEGTGRGVNDYDMPVFKRPGSKPIYTLIAEVDPTDEDHPHGIIEESNDNNNIQKMPVYIPPRIRALNTPFQNFLENHPILYQLLLRFLRL